MPTDPLESILYRDFAKVQAKEIIDLACPLLQELANYATNALVRCASSAKGQANEDLAVLFLYRHVIEMTDGIEVLISQSCAIPAIPLVRSSFEALLSIEYIAESDSKYVTRSLSWLASYARTRLRLYESLDPSTDMGQQFRESLQKDKTIQHFAMPDPGKTQKAIANMKKLLARTQFEIIEQEFGRLKSSKKGQPEWYSLFGGPSNLRDLARHLKRHAQYDFLYRVWSRTTHAQDFSPFIERTCEGQGTIRGLRDPSGLKDVANFGSYFTLEATRTMLKRFRPGEGIAPWYLKEVRPRYVRLFTNSPIDE